MYRLTTIEMTITQADTSIATDAGLTSRGLRSASGASSEFSTSSRKVVSHGRKVTFREKQPQARPSILRCLAETAESTSRTKNAAMQSITGPS